VTCFLSTLHKIPLPNIIWHKMIFFHYRIWLHSSAFNFSLFNKENKGMFSHPANQFLTKTWFFLFQLLYFHLTWHGLSPWDLYLIYTFTNILILATVNILHYQQWDLFVFQFVHFIILKKELKSGFF
jgi:hypothetical protein